MTAPTRPDTEAHPDTDLLARHLQALRARFAVYALFDAVASAALPTDIAMAVRAEGAEVVEMVMAQELDGAPAEACARGLLQGDPELVCARFSAWRKTLASAVPDRPGMALALAGFSDWLAAAPAAERVLCVGLPRIAPVLAELKTAGVMEILAAVKHAADPGTLLDAAGAYGATDGATVLAVIRLGARAAAWGDPTLLERLQAAVPPERTDESRDAERVIAAMGALVETCTARGGTTGDGDELGRAAADLVLSMAALSLSSAYATAVEVQKTAARLDPATLRVYLQDAGLLTRTVGVRVVGFVTGTLAGLYAKHGTVTVRAFVRAAADVADAYGTTAAQWFYERKTPAARGACGG